jgi:phosphate-selective porin OprO/OprP
METASLKANLGYGVARLALLAFAAVFTAPATGWTAEFAVGSVQVSPKGRLLVDSVSQVASSSGAADARIDLVRVRQAFLGLDARFSDRLALRLEGGASNNDAFIWDEAALEYRATPNLLIAAGNLKAAGLENLTSTRNISFLERGPYGDLVTDPFTSSVQVRLTSGRMVATLAVQGDTFNNLGLDFDGGASPGAWDRRAATGRLAGSIPVGDDASLHLGGWARARDFGDQSARAYAARPGTAAGEAGDWLGSGPLAQSDMTVALEGAWLSKAVWVQGEVAAVRAERSPLAPPGGDPLMTAGYVFIGWNIGGEARGYDAQRALVTAPGVGDPVSAGGLGSLDLVARYDFADLSDVQSSAASPAGRLAARRAGEYLGLTLGVVWRPEPGYRVLVNFGEAQINQASPSADVTIRQLQIRAQFEF